jgi:hypothetical protein
MRLEWEILGWLVANRVGNLVVGAVELVQSSSTVNLLVGFPNHVFVELEQTCGA